MKSKKTEVRRQKTGVRMPASDQHDSCAQVLSAQYIAGKPGEDIPTGTLKKCTKWVRSK